MHFKPKIAILKEKEKYIHLSQDTFQLSKSKESDDKIAFSLLFLNELLEKYLKNYRRHYKLKKRYIFI